MSIGGQEVEESPQRGVYGLRLVGDGLSDDVLSDALPEWPTWRIINEAPSAPAASSGLRLAVDGAEYSLNAAERIVVDRPKAVVRYCVSSPLEPAWIAHPYLALPAAVINRWEGREALHGGGVIVDGRAWALFGGKGLGKSTTLAVLANDGHGVVSDDLLIVSGITVFAGPRLADLRQDAASVLGMGDALGRVGRKHRWRVTLGPVPPTAPLGGLVFLSWGDRLEVNPLTIAECIERLFAYEALEVGPVDARAYLRLASLPAFELRRPRDLAALSQTGELLLRTAAMAKAG